MNKFVEAFVMFQYDLKGIEPMVLTTYDFSLGDKSFSIAKVDIACSQVFNAKEVEHFLMCLDFLANCSYPLERYKSIHIASSTVRTIKHYVQMNNINYQPDDCISQDSSSYKMYINYSPTYFEYRLSKKSKVYNWLAPFCLDYWTRSGNNTTTLPFDYKSKVGKIINCITLANCFVYVCLNNICQQENGYQRLIENPFYASASILIKFMYYGTGGLIVSNFIPPYSNVLVNSIFGFINFLTIKKVKQ